MMKTKIEVPAPVRELVAIGIDNAERALALFFDAVSKSAAPTSAQSLALLKRIVIVQMDYARKVARAKDLSEASRSRPRPAIGAGCATPKADHYIQSSLRS